MATSRSIVAPFAQTSFPERTGTVQPKRALPDRAESSSLAESAASATKLQPEPDNCITTIVRCGGGAVTAGGRFRGRGTGFRGRREDERRLLVGRLPY
jgi:hypothetical protein